MSNSEYTVLCAFLLSSCDDTFVSREIDEDGLHHSVMYLHNLRLDVVLLVPYQSACFPWSQVTIVTTRDVALLWDGMRSCKFDSLVIGKLVSIWSVTFDKLCSGTTRWETADTRVASRLMLDGSKKISSSWGRVPFRDPSRSDIKSSDNTQSSLTGQYSNLNSFKSLHFFNSTWFTMWHSFCQISMWELKLLKKTSLPPFPNKSQIHNTQTLADCVFFR